MTSPSHAHNFSIWALRPTAMARGLRSVGRLVGYESIGQFRRSALHSLRALPAAALNRKARIRYITDRDTIAITV